MKKYSTRRKSRRAIFVVLADIRPNPMAPPIESHVINLSYGGAAFLTKEPLKGRLEITLYLLDKKSKRVSEVIWGRISWNKKLGSLYSIGVEFIGLNEKDHRAIIYNIDEALRW